MRHNQKPKAWRLMLLAMDAEDWKLARKIAKENRFDEEEARNPRGNGRHIYTCRGKGKYRQAPSLEIISDITNVTRYRMAKAFKEYGDTIELDDWTISRRLA